MKDMDSKLIYEAYSDDGRDDLINKLKKLNKLIPDDAIVNWSISDGSFSSLTPGAVLGDEPENKSIKALIGVLMKVWNDTEYAEKLGLAGADWTGKDNYSGSIFWTANDTHYQDIYGKGSFDEFHKLKPEYEERYREFVNDKHKTDNYVSQMVGGRPESRDPGEVTPKTFENQKHWRISLSPGSESITKRGDATYDAVGYGKGRYMGD